MTLWDEVRAKNAIDGVVAKLHDRQLGLRVQTWIRGNDIYPLRATTSLNVSGPPWDDDVVLSAGVKAVEFSLTFDCNICDGSGQVIIGGPKSTSASGRPAEEQSAWAEECLEQYVRFLDQNLQIIADELHRKALKK